MEIAFIVPCYNEEKRLRVEEFVSFQQSFPGVHFFFVNDGSTDQTLDLLKSHFNSSNVIDMPKNGGKAEAVRFGMQEVSKNERFSHVGFLDADLATPLSEIPSFIKEVERGMKVILGARILRLGGEIKRKWYRHYFGRIFATCASLLLKIPVYDTQCGAKLFERGPIMRATKEVFISKWIFDVELFLRLLKEEKIEQAHFFEIPLRAWEDIGGSHLKTTDFLKAPIELFKLFLKYRG